MKIITPLHTTGTKRKINIELLRIISMIFVLLGHYDVVYLGVPSLNLYHQNFSKFLGVCSLMSLDFICVNCFIIISGYFGIRWKLRSLFNFLFQIGFFGGLLYLICFMLGHHDFQLLVMLKRMTCFLFGVNWFFVTYLGLYLISPILNAFINSSNERQLGGAVLLFYLFQTLFGWMTKGANDFQAGMSIMSFAGLYLLGAYINKSSLRCFHLSATVNILVYLGIGALCVVISVLAAYLGINKSIYSYISPFQILQTIYLFLFCRALNIHKMEKVVLFFSSSAFAALLMHSWGDGAWLYYTGLYWIYENLRLPFFAAMGYIVLFFMIACCLDKIRIFVWNHTILRLLDKYEIK